MITFSDPVIIAAAMPPFFASKAAKPSAAHRGSTWFHLSRCKDTKK
jgi:hypothetical protein